MLHFRLGFPFLSVLGAHDRRSTIRGFWHLRTILRSTVMWQASLRPAKTMKNSNLLRYFHEVKPCPISRSRLYGARTLTSHPGALCMNKCTVKVASAQNCGSKISTPLLTPYQLRAPTSPQVA
ncbi:hypothetical protein AB1N83_007826 [Pleurotus pulmonarius]